VFEWQLDRGRLSFRYRDKYFWWDMPHAYNMPSPRLKRLAEIILLSPYASPPPPIEGDPLDRRRVSVAFSGGVDSAAAYELMLSESTEVFAVHTKVADPGGMHKVENALLATRSVDGLVVESNIDTFGTLFGRSRGFYGDAGWTVTGVLLAEHLGTGSQVDGNIIDTIYLWSGHGHGTKFNHRTFAAVRSAFEAAGLVYGNPCAGLSEVLTSRISAQHEFAMGCMRGENGRPCLNCLKCFRKSALRGEPIRTNSETDRKLSKLYVPMLAELLWAHRRYGPIHPRLALATQEVGWVEFWYPRSMEHMPEDLMGVLRANIERHSIRSLKDDSAIETWDSRVPIGPVSSQEMVWQASTASPPSTTAAVDSPMSGPGRLRGRDRESSLRGWLRQTGKRSSGA
jgi:hypothetical protein